MEFNDRNDRNRVKKASTILQRTSTNFFIKADRPKQEREEYKRLYRMKQLLEELEDYVERRKRELIGADAVLR